MASGDPNRKLYSYEVNKKSKKEYIEQCERCKTIFTFTAADVKNRVVKCPKCGYDIVFFAYNF